MHLSQFIRSGISARTYCLILIAVIIGVILAQLQTQLLPWRIITLCVCAAVAMLPFQHQAIKATAFLILFILIGFSWAQWQAQHRLAQRLPDALLGRSVEISGQIISIPQTSNYGQHFIFRPAESISELAWRPEQIQISVNGKNLPFKVGEYWLFQAKLKPVHGQINPSSFDMESWFLQNNIAALAAAKNFQRLETPPQAGFDLAIEIQRWRNYFLAKINRQLGSHPYAGIIKALTIGEQNQISPEQWWRFSQTGVTHLISISGLHITMLIGLVAGLVRLTWSWSAQLIQFISAPRAAIIAGVCAGIAYFSISGMAIPSQRTIIMLLIFSISLWQQHKTPLSLVWLTALTVVVVFDPFSVLSIGFWLSFLSVGILLWACANRIHTAKKWQGWLRSQWAATLGMLPLLLVIFGQFPLISPLANAFAIPIISLLITPLALIGLIDPTGQCLQWAADLMFWCDRALNWCTALPLATWQHPPPPVWMLPTTLFGVLLILLPKGFSARYLGLALLIPLLTFAPEKISQGQFRAVVLDVGQGLSVIVQTRNHALLFDTGSLPNTERVILPALRHFNILRLDMSLFSHNDTDHIGGAELLLQRWPVQQVLHSLPADHTISHLKPAQNQLKCNAGQHWQWDQIRFEVLWPAANYPIHTDNAQSCVLRVSTATHNLVIAADIGKTEEAALLASGLFKASDVLIVPHHGSKNSSSHEFVSMANPKYAVFSAGFMNRFGHPKAEIVERYQVTQAVPLLTSQLGAIHFKFTDRIEMKAERQIHPHYWYTMPH